MAGEWSVNERAISAINNMATELEELQKEIQAEIRKLKEEFESNRSGLGPHVASIQKLIDDLEAVGEESSVPIKILVLKLTKAALIRQAVIATNDYTSVNSYGGRTR